MSRTREIGQPGFTIFWEDLDVYVQCLDDEQLGRVLRTLWCEHYDAPDWPDMTQAEDVVYYHLKQKIGVQSDRYEEKCKKNRDIAKNRGAKNAAGQV